MSQKKRNTVFHLNSLDFRSNLEAKAQTEMDFLT